MDRIKELTDFYMWMQENDYDHNIRARVERKAEMYLNRLNVGQKSPIHNVSKPVNCDCEAFRIESESTGYYIIDENGEESYY